MTLHATLHGPGAPQVQAATGVSLGGLAVVPAGPMPIGSIWSVELRGPRLTAPLTAQARVSWWRAPHAGLDWIGTWDGLLGLRRALGQQLGSRVLDGADPIGYLMADADGGWVCYDRHTIKVALLKAEGGRVRLRRRDGSTEALDGWLAALGRAFPAARRAAPDPLPGAWAAPAPPDEAEILGARTLVLGPPVREAPGAGGTAGDEAVLGARTVVLGPPPSARDQTAPGGDEEAVLGARTVVLGPPLRQEDGAPAGAGRAPTARAAEPAGARVLTADGEVGRVVPATPGSWEVRGPDGRKRAVIAAVGRRFQVCFLGDASNESLDFLEAGSPGEALMLALELSSPPTLDPPVAGLGAPRG